MLRLSHLCQWELFPEFLFLVLFCGFFFLTKSSFDLFLLSILQNVPNSSFAFTPPRPGSGHVSKKPWLLLVRNGIWTLLETALLAELLHIGLAFNTELGNTSPPHPKIR